MERREYLLFFYCFLIKNNVYIVNIEKHIKKEIGVLVYRVENRKGHGPIYGKKKTYLQDYDYRNSSLADNMRKSHPGITDEELGLVGSELIEVDYDSRQCIINHKTPRENKPYFYNRYGNGNYYYRFGNDYYFGYNTYHKALNYVKPRKKHILHREGFYIACYNVNNCIIFPDGQVAFKKKKANLVHRFFTCFS